MKKTEWDEIFSGKCFITDLGESQTVYDNNNTEIALGRYAVWSPMSNLSGHTVIEIGDDIGALMNKYSISDDAVCVVVTGKE